MHAAATRDEGAAKASAAATAGCETLTPKSNGKAQKKGSKKKGQNHRPYQATLQEYLAGTLYQRGQTKFEAHMSPFIKKCMQAAFPPTGDQAKLYADMEQLEQQDEDQKQELRKQRTVAEEAAAVAKKNFLGDKSNVILKQKMADAIKHKRSVSDLVDNKIQQIEAVKQARHKSKPTPAWLEAVHEAFPAGSKMVNHITAEGIFDMYTIGKIFQHFLHDVFRDAIGYDEYDFEAKDLLDRMQRATNLRTLRAHFFDEGKQMPTEAEVLDALTTMRRILLFCKQDRGAKDLQHVVSNAQDLYRKSASPGPPACVSVELTETELAAHFVYTGLCMFDTELTLMVGPNHVIDGPYVPTDASAWPSVRHERFKDRTHELKQIVLVRNNFAHNSEGDESAKKKKTNILRILEKMGKVLHYLDGLKERLPSTKWGGVATGWTHHSAYRALSATTRGGKVKMRVKLVRSPDRMTIPIPADMYFTGREDSVRRVTASLLQKASRVLVHGSSGVGKSTLVSEVIRSSPINSCEDIRLMAWLSGSTDKALRRDLVEVFSSHHREVVHGLESNPDECLEAIHKWLRTHDGWLFAVDDVTAEAESLFRYIPLDAPHGRVIVSSKERLDQAMDAEAPVLKTTLTERLQPLSTKSCLEIWQRMKLFPVSSQELDQMSKNVNIETELEGRCTSTVTKPPVTPVPYVPPPKNEKARDRRQRHRKMAVALREYEALTTPGLGEFLEESLGNLPVSVRLVGNMLRNDDGEYMCLECGTFSLSE